MQGATGGRSAGFAARRCDSNSPRTVHIGPGSSPESGLSAWLPVWLGL